MIWEYLVTSAINEANSSEKRQYRFCSSQLHSDRDLNTNLWSLACNTEHTHELTDRLQSNEYYREHLHIYRAEDVWPLSLESGLDRRDLELVRLVLTGHQPIKNPLVDYFLVSKQVEAEVKATNQADRYLLVECCCPESGEAVAKQSSIIKPTRVKIGSLSPDRDRHLMMRYATLWRSRRQCAKRLRSRPAIPRSLKMSKRRRCKGLM